MSSLSGRGRRTRVKNIGNRRTDRSSSAHRSPKEFGAEDAKRNKNLVTLVNLVIKQRFIEPARVCASHSPPDGSYSCSSPADAADGRRAGSSILEIGLHQPPASRALVSAQRRRAWRPSPISGVVAGCRQESRRAPGHIQHIHRIGHRPSLARAAEPVEMATALRSPRGNTARAGLDRWSALSARARVGTSRRACFRGSQTDRVAGSTIQVTVTRLREVEHSHQQCGYERQT